MCHRMLHPTGTKPLLCRQQETPILAVPRGRAIVLPRRAAKRSASEAAMDLRPWAATRAPSPHVSGKYDMLSLRCWFPRHDGAETARARPCKFEDGTRGPRAGP